MYSWKPIQAVLVSVILLCTAACDDLVEGMREASLTYEERCGFSIPPGLAEIVSEEWCKQGLTGKGVVIGVVDGGFNGFREDPFTQGLRVIATSDFVTGDDEALLTSDIDRGTNVTSSIGGRDGDTVHGLAWGASYVLVRTEDVTSETKAEEKRLVQGVAWAIDQGARVVNVSLGYSQFDDRQDDYSPSDVDGSSAIATRRLNELARAHPDVLIIVSAGNRGDEDWRFVLPPSDAELVLTVGAANSKGQRASYSGTGPSQLAYVKPDVVARPIGRGASLAAPMIAGLAAQILELDPSLSSKDVADLIRSSGNSASQPNREIGFGIPGTDGILAGMAGRSIRAAAGRQAADP